MSRILREWIEGRLGELSSVPIDEVLERRYEKIRKRGVCREGKDEPPAPEPPAPEAGEPSPEAKSS